MARRTAGLRIQVSVRASDQKTSSGQGRRLATARVRILQDAVENRAPPAPGQRLAVTQGERLDRGVGGRTDLAGSPGRSRVLEQEEAPVDVPLPGGHEYRREPARTRALSEPGKVEQRDVRHRRDGVPGAGALHRRASGESDPSYTSRGRFFPLSFARRGTRVDWHRSGRSLDDMDEARA
jgi:hypothetical protein